MYRVLFFILIFSASVLAQAPDFTIEGHRGARGWVPENTIPSFIKAFDQGADTVELDIVISGDGKVVVSHDPWFPAAISLDPKGERIAPDKEKSYNHYKMKYSEIRKFDVGSLGNKDFPQQVKMKAHKPLLSEVFREIKKYARNKKLAYFRINVEIKASPAWDGVYMPVPEVVAKLVNDEIVKAKMQENVIVQSFDERQLQQLRRMDVPYPMAYLVGNKDGAAKNLEKLGFTPDTYAPHFSLLNDADVEILKSRGIKIVPWTVNEITDMEKLKKWKLDGVITDYPDRAVQVYRK